VIGIDTIKKEYLMKRKVNVIVALMFVAIVFAVVFNAPAANAQATGTCCFQDNAICVIGEHSFPNRYYLSEGKCPPVN
jgi:hypothetical protein